MAETHRGIVIQARFENIHQTPFPAAHKSADIVIDIPQGLPDDESTRKQVKSLFWKRYCSLCQPWINTFAQTHCNGASVRNENGVKSPTYTSPDHINEPFNGMCEGALTNPNAIVWYED